MSPLVTTIVSGLILAILTGIAALAIKHHDVFDDIFYKIMIVIYFALGCSAAFFIGYDVGFDELSKFITTKHPTISVPKQHYPENYYAWATIFFVAIIAYIFFLDYLGKKIKEKQSQNTK